MAIIVWKKYFKGNGSKQRLVATLLLFGIIPIYSKVVYTKQQGR